MADWYGKDLIHPDFVNVTTYIAIGERDARETGKYGVTYDCFVYMNDENVRIGGGYRFDPLAMPTHTETTVFTFLDQTKGLGWSSWYYSL